MYYDRIKDVGDVIRLATGAVQCGANHSRGGGYLNETPRDPAVTVFVEYNGTTATDLYAMCKRHAGTVKAGITKGSWSFRGVEPVPVTVEAMALSPKNLLASLTETKRALTKQRENDSAASQLAYVRQGWDKARADYNSAEELKNPPERVEPKVDDFGRAFVRVGAQHMTPKQARNLAARLLVLASEAEVETSVQVMP